ncbi:MAG: membrane integrity-associated transporter subunit PqiC [Myxococcota bacterium]
MRRALLLIALLATACGHSEPTRFYTLAPKAASNRTSYTGAPVRLEAVHLPPSVAGHRILHGSNDHEVTISSLERWTDELDFLMRQTLAQNLVTRLPQGVVVFPDAPRPRGSLAWVVDVLTLREVSGKLECEASWSLMASDLPRAIERRQASYSAVVDGSGASTSEALSRITAELADAMAASLSEAASVLASTRSPSASVPPAP